MIRQAKEKDYDKLIKLWNSCFGDSKEDIERFLYEHKSRSLFMCLFSEDEEELLSALYLLPAKYKIKDTLGDCYYVYAVSTDEKYRNNGYSRKLLEYCKGKYFMNTPGFLVPANDELINYYQKRGYFLLHSGKKEHNCPCEIKDQRQCGNIYKRDIDLLFESGNADEYIQNRKLLLKDVDCISWGEEELKFIFDMYEDKTKKIPTPIYPPLMVSVEFKQILDENGVEDLYFTLAME